MQQISIRSSRSSATTGVASRVLATNTLSAVKTINSTLGYFDTDSLRKSRDRGTLRKNLAKIRKKFTRIIIDECSMLNAEQFEIIVAACEEVGLGLVIIGDFLQLPVIEPKPKPDGWQRWLFNTPAFAKFEIIRLTTQYRQTDTDFLVGLNLLRAGRGEEAIPHLRKAGIHFIPGGTKSPLALNFNGTTICGTNEMKDRINDLQYKKLTSEEYTVVTKRHGVWQYEEQWADIPDSVSLKIGTRVMVLRNLYGEMAESDKVKKVDTDAHVVEHTLEGIVLRNEDGSVGFANEDSDKDELLQANGDTGVVEAIEDGIAFLVRRDDGALIKVEIMDSDNGKHHFEIGADGRRTRIVDEEPTAWINYLPLAKAWAMTTHKSQGLTIDHPTRIVCESFFSRISAMAYVAISRVKNPKHLTIVGADDNVNEHAWLHWLCKADKECVEFL
jgi:hypothetical protein